MRTSRQQSCRQLLTRRSPGPTGARGQIKGELLPRHHRMRGQIKGEQWGQLGLTRPRRHQPETAASGISSHSHPPQLSDGTHAGTAGPACADLKRPTGDNPARQLSGMQNDHSVRTPTIRPLNLNDAGGSRASHDRRAVTVGNEAPIWHSPNPAPRRHRRRAVVSRPAHARPRLATRLLTCVAACVAETPWTGERCETAGDIAAPRAGWFRTRWTHGTVVDDGRLAHNPEVAGSNPAPATKAERPLPIRKGPSACACARICARGLLTPRCGRYR